jgi:hypothetical protein
MEAVSLRILRQFDRAIWQTADRLPSLLLTWDPQQEGGIPQRVARVLGEALCLIGPAIYAGDPESAGSEARELVVWRGLRRLSLALYRAGSADQLRPAFESGRHSWAMNAQWLIVLDSSAAASDVDATVATLYRDWQLPDRWPDDIAVIVQAAVDGDGAACFSANRDVEERLILALGESARVAGMELIIDAEKACG